MTTTDANAGTGAVQSLPSRKDELHRRGLPAPSADYRKVFEECQPALDACSASSFFFSPLNLLPKIALDKLQLAWWKGGVLLDNEAGTRFLPTEVDRGLYWARLLDLLGAKCTLLNVPEWAANALKKTYTVKKQQTEYLIRTNVLEAYPGGRLRNVRNLVHKARRETEIEIFAQNKLEDYLKLNKIWYKQNAESKFRTYDKTSIDWLLENFPEVQEIVPSAVIVGIRESMCGVLQNFTAASIITSSTWSAYTERFDRDAVPGSNWYAWQLLAEHFTKLEFENDGTADTTALRNNKGKLFPFMVPFYTVSK